MVFECQRERELGNYYFYFVKKIAICRHINFIIYLFYLVGRYLDVGFCVILSVAQAFYLPKSLSTGKTLASEAVE